VLQDRAASISAPVTDAATFAARPRLAGPKGLRDLQAKREAEGCLRKPMQNSPKEGMGRSVAIPSGPPLLRRGIGSSATPFRLVICGTSCRAAGRWQRIDAPMNGGSNEDFLRFVLVAAFLLAIVALLIVVALMVRQP
jgi:hypothetical protein